MTIGDVPVIDVARYGRSVGLTRTQTVVFETPLPLESGELLPAPWQLAYEVYGQLNAGRSNAVLLCHALSGDAHAAGRHHPSDERSGWWDAFVGPGRAFDTEHHAVICVNVIGGCAGSTGPASISPATGRPYGSSFPMLTIGDMVAAQVRLLDHLGIERLHAVAGGSMGGMQALELAASRPHRVRNVVAIGTTARSSAQAIAFNAIGRQAIMRDERWRGGDYYGGPLPADGMALARMVGHVTYLSEAAMAEKFDRRLQERERLGYTVAPEFAVESYLQHQGDAFVRRFDPNSYLLITKALDYFDLPARYGSLAQAFGATQARFLVLSFTSDWLYPTAESVALAAGLRSAGREVEHIELDSDRGHDAFLLEDELMTPIIREFLG